MFTFEITLFVSFGDHLNYSEFVALDGSVNNGLWFITAWRCRAIFPGLPCLFLLWCWQPAGFDRAARSPPHSDLEFSRGLNFATSCGKIAFGGINVRDADCRYSKCYP